MLCSRSFSVAVAGHLFPNASCPPILPSFTGLAWHPVYDDMFASGGSTGDLYYWQIGYAQGQRRQGRCDTRQHPSAPCRHFTHDHHPPPPSPVIRVEGNLGGLKKAHDGNIWDMDWHPLGHVLATGSNDYSAKVATPHSASPSPALRRRATPSLTLEPLSAKTVLDAPKAGRPHG